MDGRSFAVSRLKMDVSTPRLSSAKIREAALRWITLGQLRPEAEIHMFRTIEGTIINMISAPPFIYTN